MVPEEGLEPSRGLTAPDFESTAVAVRLSSPVALSRPSYTFLSEADAFHSVIKSSRFTKKSLVNVSGRSVKMPCWDCPKLAFRAAYRRREPSFLERQIQHECPLHQQLLRRFSVSGLELVAEPVRYQGSQHSRWPSFSRNRTCTRQRMPTDGRSQ
jgi:hypothetical protein